MTELLTSSVVLLALLWAFLQVIAKWRNDERLADMRQECASLPFRFEHAARVRMEAYHEQLLPK